MNAKIKINQVLNIRKQNINNDYFYFVQRLQSKYGVSRWIGSLQELIFRLNQMQFNEAQSDKSKVTNIYKSYLEIHRHISNFTKSSIIQQNTKNKQRTAEYSKVQPNIQLNTVTWVMHKSTDANELSKQEINRPFVNEIKDIPASIYNKWFNEYKIAILNNTSMLSINKISKNEVMMLKSDYNLKQNEPSYFEQHQSNALHIEIENNNTKQHFFKLNTFNQVLKASNINELYKNIYNSYILREKTLNKEITENKQHNEIRYTVVKLLSENSIKNIALHNAIQTIEQTRHNKIINSNLNELLNKKLPVRTLIKNSLQAGMSGHALIAYSGNKEDIAVKYSKRLSVDMKNVVDSNISQVLDKQGNEISIQVQSPQKHMFAETVNGESEENYYKKQNYTKAQMSKGKTSASKLYNQLDNIQDFDLLKSQQKHKAFYSNIIKKQVNNEIAYVSSQLLKSTILNTIQQHNTELNTTKLALEVNSIIKRSKKASLNEAIKPYEQSYKQLIRDAARVRDTDSTIPYQKEAALEYQNNKIGKVKREANQLSIEATDSIHDYKKFRQLIRSIISNQVTKVNLPTFEAPIKTYDKTGFNRNISIKGLVNSKLVSQIPESNDEEYKKHQKTGDMMLLRQAPEAKEANSKDVNEGSGLTLLKTVNKRNKDDYQPPLHEVRPVEKEIYKSNYISPKENRDIKDFGADEINLLADKVFKALEKRLEIRKDRRGLR